MAKFKRSDFKPAAEWIDALPEARRASVKAGAALLIAKLHASGALKTSTRPRRLALSYRPRSE